MKNIKSNSWAAVIIILACLSTRLTAQQNLPRNLEDERGIFKSRLIKIVVPLDGRDLRIVLGKAVNPIGHPVPAGDTAWLFNYDIISLCEYRQLISQGARIRIAPPKIPRGGGTGPGRIPITPEWGVGTIFLMVVATTDDPSTFEYAGQVPLIGMWTPCKVEPGDVPLVENALIKLGEISRRTDAMATKDEAERLFHSDDNYYLWALGAAAVAAQNDKPASDELYDRWISNPQLLSPRQIIWLDHCFGDVMSEGIGPDRARRHDMLIDYLKRLSDAMPTTVPSRPAQP